MKVNAPDKDSLEMGYKIASFFHQKHNLDYKKSNAEIESLKIANIQDFSDKVVISLARPGLLIGRKGMQIDALQTFLNKPIEILESFVWSEIMTFYPGDYIY